MRIRILPLLAVLPFLAGLNCCKEKDISVPAQPQIFISIATPSEGVDIPNGDTVRISGVVTSQAIVHGYVIKVRQADGNAVFFQNEAHVHSTRVAILERFVNQVTSYKECDIIIDALIDHSGNHAERKVRIGLLPPK